MVHLHVHSNYTLLGSSASIESIVDAALQNKMSAIALTDTNAMYGLIEFYKYALENKIKPILGAYLDDPASPEINCCLLARNFEGYSRICELITLRRLEDNFNLINELKSRSRNCFIISSSLEVAKEFRTFKNFYVELFYTKSRKKICRALLNFAIENKIKVVATNPVYFTGKEDFIIHKVLNAIRLNTTLANIAAEELADEECYFKSEQEMQKIWKSLPEALTNSDYIAANCNCDLRLGEYKHPEFPVPKNETPFSYLWKVAFEGLAEKYTPITEKAINRLQEELHIIDSLGFSNYFLIVRDIAHQAKKLGMMTLGRGSAANSIVAYVLGLTQVDPLEHNLYFERFLNLGRSSPPDIDIDFAWNERDSIIKYVFNKYGYDRVAMISTINTFRARSAFREVAKTFGISESEISEHSHYIPWTSAENLPLLSLKFPEARNLKLNNEPWSSIISIASKIASYPRHLSIHPGGIVIAPDSLTKYTALEFADNKGLGIIITQPDMYSIEELGLVKIDLLSQRSLAVVKETLEKIAEQREEAETKELKIFRLKK